MTREIPGRQFPEWVGGRKRLNEMLGKNVEVLATFMRHSYRASEDDPKAALSAEGVVQAQQIGEKFAPRKSGAFLRSSPSGRARETAGEIRAGISKRSTSRTSEIRARPELGSVSSDERFHEIWVAKSTEYLREHVPDLTTLSFDEQQQATREADDEVIDSWFRGESEWSTVATPRSVAARMAVILSRVLEMPKKMWNMSSVDNIFVSHKPNFEALLREIIVRSEKNAHAGAEQTVRGFESVKEIGGSLMPGEAWNILVKTDANRERKTYLHFRGRDYDIDFERLRELQAEGIEANRERRKDEIFIEKMKPDRDF